MLISINIVLILIILGFFSIFFNFAYSNTITGDPDTGAIIFWWSQIIGGFGTVVTVIVFWLNIRHDRHKQEAEARNRLIQVRDAIIDEINGHEKLFSSDKDTMKVENWEYKSRSLNIDAYESVIHSGLFTHLKSETQLRLADLYNTIKLRNELLSYLNKFSDMVIINKSVNIKEVEARVLVYVELIVGYENSIKGDLKKVKEKLEKEII